MRRQAGCRRRRPAFARPQPARSRPQHTTQEPRAFFHQPQQQQAAPINIARRSSSSCSSSGSEQTDGGWLGAFEVASSRAISPGVSSARAPRDGLPDLANVDLAYLQHCLEDEVRGACCAFCVLFF